MLVTSGMAISLDGFTAGLNQSFEKPFGDNFDVDLLERWMFAEPEKNKHKNKRIFGTQGRSVKTKIPIVGIIERGGELRAEVVPNTTRKHLQIFINKHLEEGSRINTDEWKGYKGLSKTFDHKFVRHNTGEYVQGDVHTNTLEGFWSLLKRGLSGVYHTISRKHLQRYVDEFVFRYNTRLATEAERFDRFLRNISTQIKYKDLVLDC